MLEAEIGEKEDFAKLINIHVYGASLNNWWIFNDTYMYFTY